MKLREIRQEKKISAEELAKAIRKSVKTLYKKEKEEVKTSKEEMAILSSILGETVQKIFFD